MPTDLHHARFASEQANTRDSRGGSGLLLIDQKLQPIAADDGARRILGTNGSSESGAGVSCLPEEVCQAIRAWESAGERSHSVVKIGSRSYSCKMYRIVAGSEVIGPTLVALHLDADGKKGDLLRHLATEYHLTEREAEALRGIALGLSTKELADRMMISPNTVKSFVRLIMIKLGVTSRAAIMVKLLENLAGG